MEPSPKEQNPDQYYVQTYDDSVSDWPGEIAYYRALAAKAKSAGGSVLEVACGTGRIAIRLAQDGVRVVGLDFSADMLRVASQKSAGLEHVRWVEADMRSFQIGETFALTLIPGHSFQNLNTPEDQVSCLESIKDHLSPGGRLVIHLDHMNLENVSWLGELCSGQGGVFQAAEQFQHPQSGRQTRASRAWSYEPSTQTAIVQTIWEEMDSQGQIQRSLERAPIRLHCVFRFEMEHLLARAGFEMEAIYGDFFRHELQDDSPSMIWVAKVP